MPRGGRGADGSESNVISGGNGDDILDGRGISYFLSGRRGNDTYYVDDPGDLIEEKSNAGTDSVISSISYVLPSGVENLTLEGSGALAGTGNELDNVLTGNSGANSLDGGEGNDTLSGGDGSDLLDGGGGTDTAVFDGTFSSYEIIRFGNDIRVTSRVTGETDTLVNIELLQFDDQVIAASDVGSTPPPPPQAVDDTANAAEDSVVVIPVLANDQGNGIGIIAASNGGMGSVTINPDGTITYRPAANANGTDTFTYTITDAAGQQASASVTVGIAGMNDAPLAGADGFSVLAGATLTGSSVLANDSDVDGDALTVTGVGSDFTPDANGAFQTASSAGGAVVMQADGTFTYTPAAGFTGDDSFTYQVSDGQGGQATGAVTVSVMAEPAVPYYVEGLIYGDAARLNYPDPYGTSLVVTYAFLDAVPSYYSADAWVHQDFQPFSDQQQDVTRAVLAQIASFSGLTFVETAVEEAEITFGLADTPGPRAVTYLPTWDGVGNPAGDVWLDTLFAGDIFAAGSEQFRILVHEIGHAIGLDHPAFDDSAEATRQYTAMASMPHETMSGEPTGYQLYDIAALQYIYGANTAHATSDDVYVFTAFDGTITTIWDAGGHDTLDMAGATYGVDLDLAEGAFSTITESGADNVAIAFGTVIEDAIGSDYDDRIAGNTADNRLTGGDGADIFSFGADWGADIVTDFTRGTDKLDLTDAGVGFADLSITSSDSDTLVSWEGNSILVEGVAALSQSDFFGIA